MNRDYKKHIKKISSYAAVGSIGLVITAFLGGCENKEYADNLALNQQQAQGYFIVIEEIGKDRYKIVEQYPNPQGVTRAILRKQDGTEELLSEEDLKRLSAKEAKKVESGNSRLLQDNAELSSEGMSLGEVILASAAGAIVGSWLGNKLFSNPNYQKYQRSQPGSIKSRPLSAKSSKATSSSQRKSGYMRGSSRSRGIFGFGG
jgi:hypothetical protein